MPHVLAREEVAVLGEAMAEVLMDDVFADAPGGGAGERGEGGAEDHASSRVRTVVATRTRR